MALKFETFSNTRGGNAFFKAIGHPLAAPLGRALVNRLGAAGPIAIYDPLGFATSFAELYDLSSLDIAAVYVQDLGALDQTILGHRPQPVTDLTAGTAKTVFVAAFDAERLIAHARHLFPDGAETITLDDMRLPDDMLSNRRRYLDSINFATNFAFFRDTDGHHTRLVTANYWAGYGARNVEIWCYLMDETGVAIAEWREALADGVGAVVVDSRDVRERFGLAPFTGQLFLHVVNPAGHDVVKYALDTYGDDDTVLSCTHDANAWPSDQYAGLPAPCEGETVILWVQNSHPVTIPKGAVGMNLMGSDDVEWLNAEVAPFGTHALTVDTLLPKARWPEQIEIQAGKYFVRPRYEVIAGNGRRRIAHANVERVDLTPDPGIKELGNLMGKGFLLPAPILPRDRFRSTVLPTPMATSQETLPIAVVINDASGRKVATHSFGNLDRRDSVALDIGQVLNGTQLEAGYGHMELVYDFSEGGEADGWLHGLFRYEDVTSGHAAETSFGAHIFNTVLTYRGEPQSYAGPAPGLSTRLFLRLGPAPLDTMCHLIYPASTPWHGASQTSLVLTDGGGTEVATRTIEIPCGGSLFWRYGEMFDADERKRAGDQAYVIIRDVTCRLFGYHGLMNGGGAFSFDHMFGF